MRSARSTAFVAILGLVVWVGCSSSGSAAKEPRPTTAEKVTWPAPSDPLARTRAAGLVPATREFFTNHVHAHLDVFVNGTKVTVPAGIGINIKDPGVHEFNIAGAKAYGGINPPCATPCISPLHTHDVTGVIHTESKTSVANTLGELFVEWGVRFDADCVDRFCRPDTPIVVYENGKRFTGDPTKIRLTDRKEIAVVVGDPPARIPAVGDFSSL